MNAVLEEIIGFIDAEKDHLFSDLGNLIAIPSVEGAPQNGFPFGKAVNDSLEAALEIGRRMGFEVKNHEGYVGTIDWGSGEHELGILTHVDVVPPENTDEWETDPYDMIEKDGFLCGRGVADDKGPLLSALYGVFALKKMGFVPNKRIRFIIGTNEETGNKCIEYYKQHFSSPKVSFSPDGMFTVVNREKGILSGEYVCKLKDNSVIIKGGEAGNLVPSKAEAYLSCDLQVIRDAIVSYHAPEGMHFEAELYGNCTKLVCIGKSAHAMNPTKGLNAIMGLLNVIVNCGEGVDASLIRAAEAILKLFDERHDGSAMGIACSDEISGASTVNMGILSLKDGVIRLKLDIRTPVTFSLDEIAENVEKCLSKCGFTPETVHLKHPLYIPADSELIKTLCRVYEMVTREDAVLFSIGGGTYARSFENCVCFGSVYPTEELTVHCPNERTKKENIIRNAAMYGLAAYELIK